MKKVIKLVTALCLAAIMVVAAVACGNNSSKEKVKLIDIELTQEDYAFAVKKGNSELVSDFNAFLSEIKANGKFDAIINKYFSGEGTKVGYEVSTGTVTNDETNFVVATNCPFDPFEYLGDDGKAYGVDIEIAAAYAESKNLKLVIKNIAFESILNDVSSGYSDMGMAGMTISDERLASNDFTDTYYKASQKIIVSADCTDFDECKSVADVETVLKSLTGKKIGFQTGTTGNWYVAGDEGWGYEGYSNVEAKPYDTAVTAVNDMLNGNIYAVVVDAAPAAAIVKAINK